MTGGFAATDHRVLIVVDEPVEGGRLRAALGLEPWGGEVRLLAPTCFAPGGQAGADGSRARAERALGRCLAELDTVGVEATGAVGDGEPLQAIEETLRGFAADEIVIASNPARLRRRLGADFADRVIDRFRLPVAQLAA